MTIHDLKTWPEYFEASYRGDKDFEVRKNDRGFNVYDQIMQHEYDPKNDRYTGRILHRQIVYFLEGGQFGIEEGYCVLGLKRI